MVPKVDHPGQLWFVDHLLAQLEAEVGSSRATLRGMDGKWCIHPSQVELANDVFTPTPAQFDHALAQLDAYEAATAEGRGAATFEGRMIDEASRKMAAKLVARGRAAGLDGDRLPESP